MLEWNYSYEVGNERIDSEHRIFLKIILEFKEAATQGKSEEKLIRLLNVIAKYAEFHFASEEDIMSDYQYPALSQHAYLHTILLGEIKDTSEKFQQNILETEDVSEFLLNWFVLHVSKQDAKIVKYIGKAC
jgi:hemerythrin